MSDHETTTPKEAESAVFTDKADKISDADLERVSGGINPQPLPPLRPMPMKQ